MSEGKIPPVVLALKVNGAPQVQQSFKTILDIVQRFEKGDLAAFEAALQARKRKRKAAANEEKGERKQDGEEAVRTTKRTNDQITRTEEAGAKDRERIRDNEQRSAERAAQRKIQAMLRVDRDVKRIQDRARRDTERDERQRERDAKRWVDRRDRENKKKADRLGNVILGAGSHAGSTLVRGAMGFARDVLNVGGGFTIADSVQREVSLRGQAASMAASASLAGGRPISGAEILERTRAVANEHGFDPTEIMEGVGKLKDLTGNLEQALSLAPKIAQLANATGGNVAEFGENLGNILASSPNMSTDDALKLLRVQAAQGAVAGVEVKDMAKYGSRLTAGASYYGGDRSQNIAATSAMAQLARQHGSASSPAEAALAAQRFGSDVVKHATALEAKGIKVRDGKGTLIDPTKIIAQMLDKTKGDVTKLAKLDVGDRGGKVLEGAAALYRDAGGGAKGKEAVQSYFDSLTKAVATDKEIEAAESKRLAEVDKQLEMSMNQLRDAVGTQLVPELIKLVPVIRDAVPGVRSLLEAFVRLANWASENPLKAAFAAAGVSVMGLGARISAEITKEIATAKLGELMRRLLDGGGEASSSFGKVGGAVGKAALVVGAGVVAGAATKEWVDSGFDEEKAKTNAHINKRTQVANFLSSTDRLHGLTPEQRAKAEELRAQLQSDVLHQEDEAANPSLVKMVTGTIGNIVSPNDTKEAQRVEQATQMASISATKDMIAKLTAALEANTSATREANTKGGSGGPSGSKPDAGHRHEAISNR